jgi:hypothetical protein
MLFWSSWGVHRFCDPDNIARGRAHHCWIETAGGDLIDFSLVDYDWAWPRTYLWAAAAPLRAAWRPAPAIPHVGAFWFGPIDLMERETAE